MPITFDQPVALSATADAVEIDSFAIDLDRSEMVVGYTLLAAGVAVRQSVIVLSGLDYTANITRASEIANAQPAGEVNVYAAVKAALYEALASATGLSGVVG